LHLYKTTAYTYGMQRDMYDTVTIEIIVPASSADSEGETWYDEPVKVRRFTTKDLDYNSVRGKKTREQIDPQRWNDMLNLASLMRAIKVKDDLAAEKAILNLRTNRGPLLLRVTEALIKEPGFTQHILVKELSNLLDGLRLVMWSWSEGVGLALLCPDLASALLVRVVMSSIGTSAGLRICPKCSGVFLQKRADQDYCSVKCREAHRVERWRAGRKSNEESLKELKTRKPNKRRNTR
jgi:hypothetical protein